MKAASSPRAANPEIAPPRKIAVIPVYNEEETVISVLERLGRAVRAGVSRPIQVL